MRGTDKVRDLAEAPVGRLLFRYSWPALVSMSLNALYAVVDRFWIGHGCGQDAIAALTLTFPVMLFFAAFGVFVGAGHAAVLSLKLGEGDRVSCEKTLGELVALKLIFFFILPPLIYFNIDTVLDWCGAAKVSAGAYEAAVVYLKIVLFSHVFSHLAFGLSAAMRSEGAVRRSMSCMIVGFGLNLVLDPILIFSCGMGIAGAAWATVIAMAASCFWALAYYWSGKSVVKFRLRRIGIFPAILKRAAGIGLAPFLQQFMSTVINVALAAAFAHYALTEADATRQIASLGVFQGVLILVFMPILGVQQGLQPILGYNWGHRDYGRVREACLWGFWLTTVLCVLATFIQVVPCVSRLLVRLFVDPADVDLTALAMHDLAVSNCMLWMIGLNVVATTLFQSIGRPGLAIFLSMLRQGACLLPCIWILPATGWFADPAFAIWLALPISDILCQVVTVPPVIAHMKFMRYVRRRRV